MKDLWNSIAGPAPDPFCNDCPDRTICARASVGCTKARAKTCRFCKKFFARFSHNPLGECDCPRCQGYCECNT